MELKGMILEIVYLDERNTTFLVKANDTNETLKISCKSDDFVGEVGETYELEVYFNVRDRVKNDRRFLDQVIRCTSMKRI